MSEAVTLRPRATSAPRCAVCHDVARPLKQCPRCASLFHEECRLSLARCPTLGCQATARDPEETQEERWRPRFRSERRSPWRSLAISGASAFALTVVYTLGIVFGEPAGTAFVVLGALGSAFHFLVLPFVLATRRPATQALRSFAFTLLALFVVGCSVVGGAFAAGAASGLGAALLVLAVGGIFGPGLGAYLGDLMTGDLARVGT